MLSVGGAHRFLGCYDTVSELSRESHAAHTMSLGQITQTPYGDM